MTREIEIRIVDDVTPEYAMGVLQHYLSRYYLGEVMVRQLYYTVDGSMVLALKEIGEQPFGFPYYSGKVRSVKVERAMGRVLKSFRCRRLLSPGAFGSSYDHWSGNPWSDDSSYLALVEVRGNDLDAFRLLVFNFPSGRKTVVMKTDEVLSHHMWSSSGDYLFRSMTDWYIYSLKTENVTTVYSGSTFPKHCYFVNSGANLILLDEDQLISVLDCNSLQNIASTSVGKHLSNGDTVTFSVLDPFENRILLGINSCKTRMTPFGRVVECERWLGVSTQTS